MQRSWCKLFSKKPKQQVWQATGSSTSEKYHAVVVDKRGNMTYYAAETDGVSGIASVQRDIAVYMFACELRVFCLSRTRV